MVYEAFLIGDGFRAKTLAAKVLCTLCREAGPYARSAHWKHGGYIGCPAAEGERSGASIAASGELRSVVAEGDEFARCECTRHECKRGECKRDGRNAAKHGGQRGCVRSGPRDKESSALTVESKSAGDTEQEPLSKVKESDVLKLVPKTAADSEAGVEAGPEVKRKGVSGRARWSVRAVEGGFAGDEVGVVFDDWDEREERSCEVNSRDE